jgi:hypothetical protein
VRTVYDNLIHLRSYWISQSLQLADVIFTFAHTFLQYVMNVDYDIEINKNFQ